MNRYPQPRLRLCFGFVAAVLVGCGGTVGTVNVRVTLNDDVLAGATVTFEEDGNGARGTYTGITDTTGKADLRIPPSTPGIPTGTYRVCVTKQGVKRGVTIPAGAVDIEELKTLRLTENLVPPQFAKPQTTPLIAEVRSGSNLFQFDVSAK